MRGRDHSFTRKDESLRIISDELWQQAHKPLGRNQEKYARSADGRLAGKPSSAYLLTDFIECGVCHGPMWVSKKSGQRGRPQMVYICGTHRSRPGACTHDKSVPAAELHAAVLANVKKYLAGPMIVSHLLAQMEAPAVVVEGLREREAQLRDLRAKREHIQGLSLAALPDLKSPEGVKAWQASLAPVLAVLHDGLSGDPALARQHLRWVLPKKITVTPI